jgi:general secretion pathway protein I
MRKRRSEQRRHRGWQHGLSLLEVLIAFSILTLTLSVVLLGYQHGLRNVATSGQYQRALTLAENRLAEAQMQMPAPLGESSGSAPPFEWTLISEAWQPEGEFLSTAQQLYRLRVEVRWPSGAAQRKVALETLRLSAQALESP